MSWKDKLVRGSYRGIEFFTENHTLSGGRRTQVHEFVDRDTPFSEDLGRKSRQFTINIHLIGDDYFQRRDILIRALEQRGPGELIHPYLGTRQVNTVGYTVNEDTNEGRIVRFAITFSEAGTNLYPSIEEDRIATLLDFSENAKAGARSRFEQAFSVAQQPGYVVDSARDLVGQAADAFDSATKIIAETSDTITDLAFNIRNLKAEANDLIQAPGLLAQRLQDSIELLSGVANNADDASNAYRTMFNFGAENEDELIPFDTPTREQQRLNKQSFNNYIRDLAIISAAEESVDRQFFTLDEAVQEQQSLKELINRQADTAEDINFFQDMNDLAAQLVKVVPDQDNVLPNVETLELKDTTNTLVLSYDLFEDFEKEQEIIDRNRIRHPGFVVGGQQIEVVNG